MSTHRSVVKGKARVQTQDDAVIKNVRYSLTVASSLWDLTSLRRLTTVATHKPTLTTLVDNGHLSSDESIYWQKINYLPKKKFSSLAFSIILKFFLIVTCICLLISYPCWPNTFPSQTTENTLKSSDVRHQLLWTFCFIFLVKHF